MGILFELTFVVWKQIVRKLKESLDVKIDYLCGLAEIRPSMSIFRLVLVRRLSLWIILLRAFSYAEASPHLASLLPSPISRIRNFLILGDSLLANMRKVLPAAKVLDAHSLEISARFDRSSS